MASATGRRLFLASVLAGLIVGAPVLAATTAVSDDMSLGRAQAKVTVVEYASAACPHCAAFNNEIFPDFKKKYIDSGKVHYVFREYLTPPVQVAAAGFLLARCAGTAKYFSVLDDFFHGQAEAYRTGDIRALVVSVGGKAGLSEDQVKACLSDEEADKALSARVQGYVDHDDVHSTPTFIINGAKLPESDHEVNLADLDAAIGPLLAKSRRR